MHRHRFLFPALVILTLWRFALLPTCDLSSVEAITATAADDAGWSWNGTAPLLTVLAKLGMLFGGHTEFGVRFFAPLLAMLTCMMLWRFVKDLFDEQTAAWAVVILNVIPAFNLSAIHLTASSVKFAAHAGLVWSLVVALLRSNGWHRAWLCAAGCTFALTLTDGGDLGAFAAIVCALAVVPPARPRLVQPEFWLVAVAWIIGTATWLIWNRSHGWPGASLRMWSPEWRVIPNAFRWALMASPLLIYVLAKNVRPLFKRSRFGGEKASIAFLFGYGLPLAVLDFAWGTWHLWPDAGQSAWLLIAAIILANGFAQSVQPTLKAKVSLRTALIGLATIQSAFLMRTDLIRSAGIPWPLAQNAEVKHIYTRFLTADPSGSMHGWRETGKIVRSIAGSQPQGGWFLLAKELPLAAPVSFYSGIDARVIADISRDRPPPAVNAIYISDDPKKKSVPKEVARMFKETRIVSIADVMHGGHKARSVKIFACLQYHAPDQ